MRFLTTLALAGALFGSTLAASPPYQIQGDLTEACPCNSTCPCHFGSNDTYGHCEGVLAYHIQHGKYGATPLDGLTVIAVSWFGPNMKAAIGKMPAKLYIDSKATAAQRTGLLAIFGEQFKAMVGKVYPPTFMPIKVTPHGDYSTISSKVVDLDIIPTKSADGSLTKIDHAPLALIPMEYIGTSRVNRFTDASIHKKWNLHGRHANYGPFEMNNEKKPGSMEHN